jgi:ribose 5-phosphate isomerase B
MSIAANKVSGARAALVSEPVSAALCRQHNDANILCLGARMIGPTMAQRCVEAFLSTPFDPGDDGRHKRRVEQMARLERDEPVT